MTPEQELIEAPEAPAPALPSQIRDKARSVASNRTHLEQLPAPAR